jgi:hypothetical protein
VLRGDGAMDAAMDWFFRNPWILWVVTIIAVAIYGTRNEFLARKRTTQAKCARCGKDFDEQTRCEQVRLAAQGMIVSMCSSCKARTLRNYRAVYYVLLLGFVVGISALVTSTAPILAKGLRMRWTDFRPLLDVLLIVVVLSMLVVEVRRALARTTTTRGKLES